MCLGTQQRCAASRLFSPALGFHSFFFEESVPSRPYVFVFHDLCLVGQTVSMTLTATGYSAVYNGDYLSTMYGNGSLATAGNTAMIAAGFNDLAGPTQMLTVKKDVPVTIIRAAVPGCSSTGDPHIWTFDRFYYSPHVDGEKGAPQTICCCGHFAANGVCIFLSPCRLARCRRCDLPCP